MATKITFQNPQGSQTVEILWVSPSGKEIQYKILKPGVSFTQSTYEAHEWVVREADGGGYVMGVVAQKYEQNVQLPQIQNERNSRRGTQSTIEFTNQGGAQTVKIYWIDDRYNEHLYATLAPGQSHKQGTQLDHWWQIREAQTGKVLIKTEGRAHNQQILIPNTAGRNQIYAPPRPEAPKYRYNNKNKNNHDYKTMIVQGVKIHYTQEALDNNGAKMTNFLTDSINEIERLIPSKAWQTMQTVEIYVNNDYRINGENKQGACVHWSDGWLKNNGDLVEKQGNIEIYDIGDLLKWTGTQPSVILHEMAHGYHWRQGHWGANLTPLLEENYKKAMADGKYDKTKHWSGREPEHYAKTNPMEYFAESVESFFSSNKFRNDLYPFVHSEFREFDRDSYDMVAKIFEVDADQYYNTYQDFEGYHPNIRRGSIGGDTQVIGALRGEIPMEYANNASLFWPAVLKVLKKFGWRSP